MDRTVSINGRLPEDLRADCARTVFVNYWNAYRPKGLDKLRSQARQFASDGEYPYVAMAQMIESSNLAQEQVAGVVADASQAYEKGSRFENEDRAYIYFLKMVQAKTPQSDFRRALEYAVDKLLTEQKTNASGGYIGQTYTSKGVVSFHNVQDSLLFELIPLAQATDPSLVDRIVRARPQFKDTLGAQVQGSEGVFVFTGEGTPAAASASALEAARVQDVQEIAPKDTKQALLLAQSISDPTLKATALAYVAAAFQATDPARAAEMTNTLRKTSEGLDTGPAKVTMLTALAETAARAKDDSTFDFAFQRALDLGVELFQEDFESYPSKPAYDDAGFDDLGKLVKLGIKMHPGFTLDAISELNNDVLQAYLLIDAAQALHEISSPSRN